MHLVSNLGQAVALLRETPLGALENRTSMLPGHRTSWGPTAKREQGEELRLAGRKPATGREKRYRQRPGRGFSYPALQLKSNLDENRCTENKCACEALVAKSRTL